MFLMAILVPIIPGHEIVGRVDALGDGVTGFQLGERMDPMARPYVQSLPIMPVGPQKPLR